MVTFALRNLTSLNQLFIPSHKDVAYWRLNSTQPTYLLKWNRQFLTDFMLVRPILTSNDSSITVLTFQKNTNIHKYAVTHSATHGPAQLRSTPLMSQSSPGNSSGLGKKIQSM